MLTKYNQPVRSFQLIPPEIGCKSIFARLTIHQINSLYRHNARDQWSAKHTTAIPHKSHTPPIRGSPPLTSLHLTETSTPRFETGKVFVDSFRVMNSTREYPTRYGSAHLTVSRHLFYCSWLNRLFIGTHQWISKEFQLLRWKNVTWWEEQDGQLHPWTRSNQVDFCNGEIFEVEVNNLDALKKSKLWDWSPSTKIQA